MQESNQISCDVSTREIQSLGHMFLYVTLVHTHTMCHTITGIQYNTSKKTLSIQSKHSLSLYLKRIVVVLLEHVFAKLFLILFGIQRSFGEKNSLSFTVGILETQFVLKRIVPKMFHICPILNNSVLDRISNVEIFSNGGSFVSYHDRF